MLKTFFAATTANTDQGMYQQLSFPLILPPSQESIMALFLVFNNLLRFFHKFPISSSSTIVYDREAPSVAPGPAIFPAPVSFPTMPQTFFAATTATTDHWMYQQPSFPLILTFKRTFPLCDIQQNQDLLFL